jgi:diguanylate cyclase (GGDEF)-like protein/PAS domain S-box-containing protein
LLETSAAAVVLLDAQGKILYATPATSRLCGVQFREIPGHTVTDFIDPADTAAVREMLEDFSRHGGMERESELRCCGFDGVRKILSSVWTNRLSDPAVGAIVATFRDVTEFKRAAALQSALYRIAAKASAVEEMSEFYASIHSIVGELLDAKNFYIALYDRAEDLLTFPYFVDESDHTPQPMRPGKGLTALVLRSGQPLFVTDETFNEMAGRGEVDLVGVPSADWLGVPLKIGGETIGVLAVQSYVPTTRYVESEKAVLTFVSQHVAAALEHKRAVEALRASEERYRQLFERNLAGVYRSTIDGKLLDCNDAFVRIFGYESRDDIRARNTRELYPNARVRSEFIAEVRKTGTVVNFELCCRRKDGSPIWVLENVSLVGGPEGERSILEGTLIDITDRKRAEAQIQHLAFHDALTGLPNRALLNDRLAVTLAHCRREKSGLALLFLDLDRFKDVNDSLGHNAGDRLLQAVAERLRATVREQDTIARVGGDEFVLLVNGVVSEADARLVAEKVLQTITQPFVIDEKTLLATASVGVSLYPEHGADPEALIRIADNAMYGVKASGRNGFRVA